MAEDAFVSMLLEVAGGTIVDDSDVDAARAAALWILAYRTQQVLEIRTRLAPGKGWLTHARHQIGDLGHGLDILAAEGLLPAEFSALGRRALGSYAEAMDQAAGQFAALADGVTDDEIAEFGPHYAWEMRIRSATMNRAADQARAFRRSDRLAVP
jgi:hypothetical protein